MRNFKVGERVKVKKWEDMVAFYGIDDDGSIDTLGGYVFEPVMKKYCEQKATIIGVDNYKVALVFDNEELGNPREYVWTMNMLEGEPMSSERMMELLNRVVDHVCVARDTKESIQKLLYVGFTAKELVSVFRFGADDVRDAEESMDEYED